MLLHGILRCVDHFGGDVQLRGSPGGVDDRIVAQLVHVCENKRFTTQQESTESNCFGSAFL